MTMKYKIPAVGIHEGDQIELQEYGLRSAGVTGLSSAVPTYETLRLRINKLETFETVSARKGKEAAERQFACSGEPIQTTRPFERVYLDGTELRQIATLGDDLKIAGSKLKLVYGFDDYTQFVMPPVTFPGPYREEMSVEAIILPFGFAHGTTKVRKKLLKRQVQELGSCLRGAVHATALQTNLGLPLYAIEQLCCHGIIDQERHPGVLHLRPTLMAKAASCEALYSSLETGAQRGCSGADTAQLGTAARRIGARMKPWAAIVAALLDGTLPYWLGSGPNFARRIRVRRADMVRFDQVEFIESDYPEFSFSQNLVRRDADEILNFDANQSRELLKQKLIKFNRCGNGLRSDRTDVLMLARRVVSPGEISERSGRSSNSISGEMNRLKVPRIAFGWDRQLVSNMEQFAGIL